MPDLVRNLKSEVVHRPGCKYSGSTVPWNYAAGRSMRWITLDTADHPWLHLCMFCLPGACLCARCRDLFGETADA